MTAQPRMLLLIGLLASGCKGDSGPAGPAGAQGQPGPTGNAGASATVTTLEPGSPECPGGGAKLSAGNSIASVCNGTGSCCMPRLQQSDGGVIGPLLPLGHVFANPPGCWVQTLISAAGQEQLVPFSANVYFEDSVCQGPAHVMLANWGGPTYYSDRVGDCLRDLESGKDYRVSHPLTVINGSASPFKLDSTGKCVPCACNWPDTRGALVEVVAMPTLAGPLRLVSPP